MYKKISQSISVNQQRVIVKTRNSHSNRYNRVARKSSRENGTGDILSSLDDDDPYEVLGISRESTNDEVKKAYKRQMKLYHPDLQMRGNKKREDDYDGSIVVNINTRASKINKAFVSLSGDKRELTDLLLRETMKEDLRKNGFKEPKAGVVGPMNEMVIKKLIVCGQEGSFDDECSIDVREVIIEDIAQWAQTLAYSSEMPLPMPIQVDKLDRGVRMAFVRWNTDSGSLEQVGSIWIEYDDDGGFLNIIRRWENKKSKNNKKDALPGEERILDDFYEHFDWLKAVGMDGLNNSKDEENDNKIEQRDARSGIKGVLSAIVSFTLPILPTPSFGKKTPGGAYSAYSIKKNHRTTDIDLGF
jgi:curved DNA-binding protein CbpA